MSDSAYACVVRCLVVGEVWFAEGRSKEVTFRVLDEAQCQEDDPCLSHVRSSRVVEDLMKLEPATPSPLLSIHHQSKHRRTQELT